MLLVRTELYCGQYSMSHIWLVVYIVLQLIAVQSASDCGRKTLKDVPFICVSDEGVVIMTH